MQSLSRAEAVWVAAWLLLAVQSLSHVQLLSSMDCSPQGSSLHRFSGQEYWSGLPCPSSRYLPDPEIEPGSPALQAVSCMAGEFFTNSTTREALLPVASLLDLTVKWQDDHLHSQWHLRPAGQGPSKAGCRGHCWQWSVPVSSSGAPRQEGNQNEEVGKGKRILKDRWKYDSINL